jgi:hypothetical protein
MAIFKYIFVRIFFGLITLLRTILGGSLRSPAAFLARACCLLIRALKILPRPLDNGWGDREEEGPPQQPAQHFITGGPVLKAGEHGLTQKPGNLAL